MPRARLPARLYQRPDSGEWIIRDGSRSVRTGFGHGERERAEGALAEYLLQRAAPSGPARPEELTVGEALALYARDRGPSVADPERLAYAIEALARWWGNRPCSDVRGETCRDYAASRTAKNGRPISPNTVRRELGTLGAAMEHARRERYLTLAPAVTLPPRDPPLDRSLTRSEAAALLRAASPHCRRFILVALYTGTRHRAILGLRWTPSLTSGWVDLERGIIHRRGAAEGETKKRRGSVRIPRPLLAHMRRWHRAGGSHVVQSDGGPIASIRKAFARACERAGLEGITPHTLKHTAVTWAFERGMTITQAVEFFSTSSDTLERVYWQHSPEHQTEAAEIMGRKA
jgi:integrase